MLIELVKKYKLKKEQQKHENDEFFKVEACLTSKTDFQNLDINSLLKFLEEVNYNIYSKTQITTTIDYIKRNNLFDDSNCQKLLTDIINSLEALTPKYSVNLDDLLERINFLEESLTNNNSFITDLDLIEIIVKENDLDSQLIYNIMLEVDNHNKSVIGEIKEFEKIKVTELLNKYGYTTNLTEYETNLLNIPDLEEKLIYISNIEEFNFLKQSKLKLILILLAPSENIKEIYKLTKETNLKLEDIFPIFYLSENFKIQDNSFYSNFTGSFETFTKNARVLFNLGYDLNDLYENYGGLFYTNTNDLISNIETLTKYGITLKIPSVLEGNDLENKIDRFIELGLYDYIKQFPQSLLNKDKALFHRIYYAKCNDLPIKNRYLSKEITSINGYMINEENYQELVPTYKSPKFSTTFFQNVIANKPTKIDERIITNVIKVLDDNFQENNNVYKISDTKVSRNKVLRLFQSFLNFNESINYFEGLLFSILNDLLINKDEFDLIVLNVLGKYINSGLLSNEEAINISKSLNVDNSRIESIFVGGNRI